jgi:hypothetical protein
LNLCPFAKAVHLQNQIRYFVSSSKFEEQLLGDLKAELINLRNTDPKEIDTTLVIHPHALADFTEFTNFLVVADSIIKKLKLEGEVQIASFHPCYQFAGTSPEDIENYTNRSPYPILQLLRESSIQKGLETVPNPDSIFEKNIKTMKKLGHGGWKKLF